MRRPITTIATLIALGSLTGYGQSAPPWNLVAHTIATDLRGGYQVLATDINNDKRTDLVVVPISKNLACLGSGTLKWYENRPAK